MLKILVALLLLSAIYGAIRPPVLWDDITLTDRCYWFFFLPVLVAGVIGFTCAFCFGVVYVFS